MISLSHFNPFSRPRGVSPQLNHNKNIGTVIPCPVVAQLGSTFHTRSVAMASRPRATATSSASIAKRTCQNISGAFMIGGIFAYLLLGPACLQRLAEQHRAYVNAGKYGSILALPRQCAYSWSNQQQIPKHDCLPSGSVLHEMQVAAPIILMQVALDCQKAYVVVESTTYRGSSVSTTALFEAHHRHPISCSMHSSLRRLSH